MKKEEFLSKFNSLDAEEQTEILNEILEDENTRFMFENFQTLFLEMKEDLAKNLAKLLFEELKKEEDFKRIKGERSSI
ncbi:hypothetical protein DMB92_08530 [Campylobacter sp. MIT 99-7217]|uniref:hypothetical protein n=1 Tax=Campylobacter sp. MIT 99-7217 TaxID=535091 RepID=UPI00115B05D6|nr:hypothetical protein [Campylobacter sp. MIT 99-7217]TQR29173.1 hypothetical protein DMB92_08530 [Campylobacter sp. MIT 99-7217]